jgi:hypothetical protein
MHRTSWLILLGVLLAMPGDAWAADTKGPVGTYKFLVLQPFEESTLYLFKMDNKDGKWLVTVAGSQDGAFKVKAITGANIAGNRIRFTLKIERPTQEGTVQKGSWTFEGNRPRDKGKSIYGSLALGPSQVFPARLEPTRLTKLDRFSLDKEELVKHGDSYKAIYTILVLVRQAKAEKVKPEEIKGWADKAFKIAERYGRPYQQFVARSLASGLDAQNIAPAVALDCATKAAELLDPAGESTTERQTLELLVSLLKKAKKDALARKYEARLAQLAEKSHGETVKKSLPFEPVPYKGRKSKSTRVVLVEQFTCAQNPAAVAADLALDGLDLTFKTSEVVVLHYHLNIPGPDALSNPASWARRKYYVDDLEETPTAFVNGQYAAEEGQAEDRYEKLLGVIEPLLEKAAKVKLNVRAHRVGDKVTITAEASSLEKPGPRVRLRLALVEEVVRYVGRNERPYHHHVVRALPGGADGLALTRSFGKQSASVDLKKLREELNTYLDTYGKRKPFPTTERPMDLTRLRVVAFVQNDDTREVLQAVEVKVATEGTKVGKK